ncbi:type IV toxin-antitoxin system AbiEi family antitoxin domain-containing protein [Geodermatophilus sp. SYSU D01119]
MDPELARVAEQRFGVFTSREAAAAGYRPDEIRAGLSARRWCRLRRGVYIRARDLLEVSQDEGLRHAVDCHAVVVSLGAGPVVSHDSAARLHGIVLPRDAERVVRLTDEGQWRRGRGYVVARASLTAVEVGRLYGLPVTTPARTLVDCAREWQLTDSVVAMDAALHRRLVRAADLRTAVLRATHWVGIGDAARALGLADGRAESPLETRGRLALMAAGLPAPDLQVEVHGPRGFVARVDGWYEDAAVAVEFDGRVKYADPREGLDPGEVLWREKRREDQLRELGVRVLRLTQADVVPRARADLRARLAALLAVPHVGQRRFAVARRAGEDMTGPGGMGAGEVDDAGAQPAS